MFVESSVLARGLVLGFAVAATFGPIGLLCLRRTIASGFSIGFASGLGAATADAAYASLAAFSLSAITGLLVDQIVWLRLVGGLFLIYLGASTLRAQPARSGSGSATPRGLVEGFASTLVLTLSNPMTILSFVGIFAGVGLGGVESRSAAALLVVGVFAGSAAWWLILAAFASRLRERLTPRVFRAVNVASGALILVFGATTLATQFSLNAGG
jgi:threonine/homoserine/homoserine lactone efflux protein